MRRSRGTLMTPELAVAITHMRLVQTAGLLENHDESEALRRALESVVAARRLMSTVAVDDFPIAVRHAVSDARRNSPACCTIRSLIVMSGSSCPAGIVYASFRSSVANQRSSSRMLLSGTGVEPQRDTEIHAGGSGKHFDWRLPGVERR